MRRRVSRIFLSLLLLSSVWGGTQGGHSRDAFVREAGDAHAGNAGIGLVACPAFAAKKRASLL